MVRTAGRVYLALFASTFLVYTDLLLRKWHFVTRPSISLPDIMDGWDGTGSTRWLRGNARDSQPTPQIRGVAAKKPLD